MNCVPSRLGKIVLAITLLLPAFARAAASDAAVTGNGRVVLKRQPQILRAQLVLTGEGKTIAEAAEKLKEAQAAAGKKLAELGASEKSVEFGATQVGTAGVDARQQMYAQRMVTMRGGRGAKPAALPKTVTVSSTLKAEWSLKPGTPEELLINSYTLQEKIKGAGLAKKDKEAKQLTPEEQEALEEAQGMQGGEAADPSAPSFQYVNKVAEEDQAAALAEAFQKAKADAVRLAKAAGGDLGALRQVSSATSSPTGNPGDENQAYQRFMIRQMMGASAPADSSDTSNSEATAPQPGPVELQIVVTASFGLK
ncbi:MAG: hypothetical protein JWM97_360 [Phycisphaerales bacterium]|nr:hypothetical protein [Phycisphaerales bacterium]